MQTMRDSMRDIIISMFFLLTLLTIISTPFYLIGKYNTRQNCELTNKLVYRTKFVTYGFLNLSYKCFAFINTK